MVLLVLFLVLFVLFLAAVFLLAVFLVLLGLAFGGLVVRVGSRTVIASVAFLVGGGSGAGGGLDGDHRRGSRVLVAIGLSLGTHG